MLMNQGWKVQVYPTVDLKAKLIQDQYTVSTALHGLRISQNIPPTSQTPLPPYSWCCYQTN